MSTANSILGTWRLRTYEVWSPEGQVTTPLGPSPVGYAVFDQGGHAFIQLARSHGTERPESEHARETLAGSFTAYFGTYKLNSEGTKLSIEVEASNRASYVSSTQVRTVSITETVLTMGQPGQYRAVLLRQQP